MIRPQRLLQYNKFFEKGPVTMKKKFACEVDCAACASKLEEALKKVEGVEDCSVNFLTQKMTLTAPDDRYEEVLHAVVQKAKKVDPDTVITV